MMILFYLLTKALHTPQEYPPMQFENNMTEVLQTPQESNGSSETSALRLMPEVY